MTSKKARNLLIGLLTLGIVIFVAISFLGLSMISKKSQAMVALKTKSNSMDAQLINLNRAKKDVEKYNYFNDIASSVIPKDKNQVQAIADIFQIAEEAGISLQSVTFPISTLGSKPAATANNTGGQTAPSQQQQPASGAAANTSTQSAISQAKPFSAVPGLYSLEVTVMPQVGSTVPANKQVTYPKFIQFLNAIENNRRTAQITQVSIQPMTTDNTVSDAINFTLILNIFIKP